MKRTSLYYRLILAAALLAWCSGTAHAELRVVTTVKPIHSLVASVMGGIGKPYLIVKGAASPHTYAMKPSDAAALQNAQVIFRVGGPFERFLEAAIKNGNASANVVSMSDISNVRRLPYRTGQAWGTAKHHHHGHKHDSKEDFDPHIWLDPHNALQMVGAIAQTLGLEQPSRMFDFARNAAAVAARIKDLQAATEAQSARYETGRSSYSTMHFSISKTHSTYVQSALYRLVKVDRPAHDASRHCVARLQRVKLCASSRNHNSSRRSLQHSLKAQRCAAACLIRLVPASEPALTPTSR